MILYVLQYDVDLPGGDRETWNALYTPIEIFLTKELRDDRKKFITENYKNKKLAFEEKDIEASEVANNPVADLFPNLLEKNEKDEDDEDDWSIPPDESYIDVSYDDEDRADVRVRFPSEEEAIRRIAADFSFPLRNSTAVDFPLRNPVDEIVNYGGEIAPANNEIITFDGEVGFGWFENWNDRVQFACGVLEDGTITDLHDVNNDLLVMTVLINAGFAASDIEVGIAENTHEVVFDSNTFSYETVVDKIKEALIRAGAKEAE